MHYRDTILEINMDNCFHNLEIIKQLEPNKKIIAVVKANAYGHGIKGFCTILEKYNKVDYFAVATLDEAVNLRMSGIKKGLLVLGAVSSEYFDIAYENNVQITCYNLKTAQNIHTFDKKLNVHIKVDTGMNRIGFTDIKTFKEALNLIDNSKSNLVGLFTHLSSADTNQDYTKEQIDIFKNYYDIVKDRQLEIHVQNSAGIINNNLDFVTAIRPGLIMYGHNNTDYNRPDMDKKSFLNLKELITLKSKVIMLKDVNSNSKIGYNGDYINKKPTKIATLPIGYADGYKTTFKNLQAIKDDFSYKIRGKVCMDQLMVEVDNNVSEGDYLYLINDVISAKKISNTTYTSIYELLTSLSNRIYREFYVDGKLVAYENTMFFNTV